VPHKRYDRHGRFFTIETNIQVDGFGAAPIGSIPFEIERRVDRLSNAIDRFDEAVRSPKGPHSCFSGQSGSDFETPFLSRHGSDRGVLGRVGKKTKDAVFWRASIGPPGAVGGATPPGAFPD